MNFVNANILDVQFEQYIVLPDVPRVKAYRENDLSHLVKQELQH